MLINVDNFDIPFLAGFVLNASPSHSGDQLSQKCEQLPTWIATQPIDLNHQRQGGWSCDPIPRGAKGFCQQQQNQLLKAAAPPVTE